MNKQPNEEKDMALYTACRTRITQEFYVSPSFQRKRKADSGPVRRSRGWTLFALLAMTLGYLGMQQWPTIQSLYLICQVVVVIGACIVMGKLLRAGL